MDLGEGMNNYCQNSIQSVGRDFSFTALLNMVAKDAEMSKYPVDRSSQLNEEMVLRGGKDILIEKNISDIETSLSQKLHTHASTNVAGGESHLKETSSLQVSSNYSSIRSDGQSSVGGLAGNDMGVQEKNKEGGMFTPLLGKKLFHEERDTSSKRIKVEKDIHNSVEPGKCEPFILSQDDITAIIETGSGIAMCPSDKKLKDCMFSKLKCKQRGFAPHPWMTGARKKRVTIRVTNDLYDWLVNNNASTLRRNWIVHALPKYIELDGYELKDIFIKRKGFTPEAFDIALRRTIQLDSSMYGSGKKLCWRHIMESDFAMLVLGSNDPLECISIIYQFTMLFNEYDISECRMIIIPAFVEMNWYAYYWDMEELRIHVLDPMYAMPRDQRLEDIHKVNIGKIQDCLEKVVDLLFEGWRVRWSDFRANFVEPIISGSPSGGEGGSACTPTTKGVEGLLAGRGGEEEPSHVVDSASACWRSYPGYLWCRGSTPKLLLLAGHGGEGEDSDGAAATMHWWWCLFFSRAADASTIPPLRRRSSWEVIQRGPSPASPPCPCIFWPIGGPSPGVLTSQRPRSLRGSSIAPATMLGQVVRPRRRCQFGGGATRRRAPDVVKSSEDLIAFSDFLLGSSL
ncbi:uncharacterized protein LOC124696413 [Lolium rigidum]|uniref:uncharacterized protein LOC124696413 n=1 Tax=Lolium rigidum TaxID=89674 RepID=UPI001F5C940C|nr:uncharacterized protein LOC124696413 [Lolium rigidum]